MHRYASPQRESIRAAVVTWLPAFGQISGDVPVAIEVYEPREDQMLGL
jgi:hypothetical protein